MWRKTRQPVNNIAYRTSEAAATTRDKLGHSAGDVMIVTRIESAETHGEKTPLRGPSPRAPRSPSCRPTARRRPPPRPRPRSPRPAKTGPKPGTRRPRVRPTTRAGRAQKTTQTQGPPGRPAPEGTGPASRNRSPRRSKRSPRCSRGSVWPETRCWATTVGFSWKNSVDLETLVEELAVKDPRVLAALERMFSVGSWGKVRTVLAATAVHDHGQPRVGAGPGSLACSPEPRSGCPRTGRPVPPAMRPLVATVELHGMRLPVAWPRSPPAPRPRRRRPRPRGWDPNPQRRHPGRRRPQLPSRPPWLAGRHAPSVGGRGGPGVTDGRVPGTRRSRPWAGVRMAAGLIAPTGGGKTTLALALIRNGTTRWCWAPNRPMRPCRACSATGGPGSGPGPNGRR